MKKALVSIAAIVLASSMVFGQDLNAVTEIYNAAAAALSNSEKESALESFEKALPLAEALGAEGADIVSQCKGIIPNLTLSIAKDLVKAANFDGAIEKLNAAKAAK